MKKDIAIVAAVAENMVIGRAGDLPWHLPADLRHFRQLTIGQTIIVGRKTHQSILRRRGGKPLPDRTTVILSRQADYRSEGCIVVRSWEEALDLLAEGERGFVIGGAEVYQVAIPHASRLYLTRVHAQPDGNTYFPDFDPRRWRLVGRRFRARDQDNIYDLTFEAWEREW